MNNGKEKDNKSFWMTMPGILSGCAAIITAIAALIGALVALGFIGPAKQPETPAIPLPTNTQFQNDSGNSSPASVEPNFLLTFEKFHYCNETSSTPWVAFRIENTGDLTFVYKLTKIVDTETGNYLYGSGDGFSSTGFHVDSDTCGVSEKATLSPGEVAFMSYALSMPEAIDARHLARATITLCEQPGPDFGECVEKRVDFTLYYP